MKKCATCKAEKSFSEFYKYKDKYQYACKKCQNTRSSRWHASEKAYNNARVRNNHLKKKYGIDAEIYEEMLAEQSGVCWICKRPPKTKRLSVDHNHKTGKIRGLLCYWCNHKLLPTSMENITILRKAAEYLEHFDKP